MIQCLNPDKSILVKVKHHMVRQRVREEVGEHDMNKTLKHYSRRAHFHPSHDGFSSMKTEAAIILHNITTLSHYALFPLLWLRKPWWQ